MGFSLTQIGNKILESFATLEILKTDVASSRTNIELSNKDIVSGLLQLNGYFLKFNQLLWENHENYESMITQLMSEIKDLSPALKTPVSMSAWALLGVTP